MDKENKAKALATEASAYSDKEQGLRYNQGKLQWSLVDWEAMEPMVEVLMFQAKKYSPDNWKKGFPYNDVIDSMLRHIFAFQQGEDLDPESGLSHIGHIMCNAMFLSYMLKHKKEFDNRFGNLTPTEKKDAVFEYLKKDFSFHNEGHVKNEPKKESASETSELTGDILHYLENRFKATYDVGMRRYEFTDKLGNTGFFVNESDVTKSNKWEILYKAICKSKEYQPKLIFETIGQDKNQDACDMHDIWQATRENDPLLDATVPRMANPNTGRLYFDRHYKETSINEFGYRTWASDNPKDPFIIVKNYDFPEQVPDLAYAEFVRMKKNQRNEKQ